MNKHAKRFSTDKDIRAIVQKIRQFYVPRKEYMQLEKRFYDLLNQRRADAADGVVYKTRGLMLVGESGSGKTTAIRQLLSSVGTDIATDTDQAKCEFIGLQVPSPATMKFVGAAAA